MAKSGQEVFAEHFAHWCQVSGQVKAVVEALLPNDRIVVLVAPKEGNIAGEVLFVSNAETDQAVAMLEDLLGRTKALLGQLRSQQQN
jgi:hypothetical protein